MDQWTRSALTREKDGQHVYPLPQKFLDRKVLGANKVTYTYLLSSWFSKLKYKDMLEYIKSVPGCDYILLEE